MLILVGGFNPFEMVSQKYPWDIPLATEDMEVMDHQQSKVFSRMSHDFKGPRFLLFRGFVGDDKLPIYMVIISYTIMRIPIKQPVYWKVRM